MKEAAILFSKGLCMGSADIVPGVSGGTIALIMGIYGDLITAIKSANFAMLKQIASLDVKGALANFHIRFLLPLLLGIGVAIISLSRLVNYLLHHHPVYTWSLFFGLIGASILIVGRQVSGWTYGVWLMFFLGATGAHLVVNIIPMATPETLSFIFLSGTIAICAMILPGLSGAFILLILGKYEYITGCLKNPLLPENMLVICVFCLGCITGIMGFSRILHFFLNRYQCLTLSFLAGLMTGSMQKIWPWKEVLAVKLIRGKEHVIWGKSILPETYTAEIFFAIALMCFGFLLVFFLDRLVGNSGSKPGLLSR